MAGDELPEAEEDARAADPSPSLVTRPATIMDVAALAGVSRTTVSRVLNHPELVPQETIAHVQRAVSTLKFKPNSRARSMRTGRSNIVALLVGDAAQPFHGALAKSVLRAAEARGLNVVLCDLDHSEERLTELLQQLPRQGVDGVMIATGDDIAATAVAELIEETRRRGTPVVVSGRPISALEGGVGVDFATIAYEATRLLIAGGSVRPALFIGAENSYVGRGWSDGYRRALEEQHFEPMVIQSQTSDLTVTDLILATLQRKLRPDGIVAGTVPLALSALRAAAQSGIRIPRDLAVIACEEVELAELVTPAITTISVTPSASGKALLDTLWSLILGQPPEIVALPNVLNLRDTTLDTSVSAGNGSHLFQVQT